MEGLGWRLLHTTVHDLLNTMKFGVWGVGAKIRGKD